MTFHFYCPVHFEPWDWRNPDEIGIGGSETAVVEMARRLAARGHEVTVYAPIREDCPAHDADSCPHAAGRARWLPLAAADFDVPGVWVLSRCPAALDHFEVDHPGQRTWLVCQDVHYSPVLPDGLKPERSAKLDVCFPLCRAQERYILTLNPELAGKMVLSTNGLRTDLIERIENESGPRVRPMPFGGGLRSHDDVADPGTEGASNLSVREALSRTGSLRADDIPACPVRDPFRVVYTSSPDRGLPALLRIVERAREFEPRLNLRAAYGFDNIDKCKGKHWKRIKAECERYFDRPWVQWLGRLPQPLLYCRFLSAGLWVYPTTFTETSCCTCMEAQACGAIPITNPTWALEDNVRHGSFIAGDPNDPLVEARYVGEILRWTRDLAMQEGCRAEMMPWARATFDWERVVDQYEEIAI